MALKVLFIYRYSSYVCTLCELPAPSDDIFDSSRLGPFLLRFSFGNGVFGEFDLNGVELQLLKPVIYKLLYSVAVTVLGGASYTYNFIVGLLTIVNTLGLLKGFKLGLFILMSLFQSTLLEEF